MVTKKVNLKHIFCHWDLWRMYFISCLVFSEFYSVFLYSNDFLFIFFAYVTYFKIHCVRKKCICIALPFFLLFFFRVPLGVNNSSSGSISLYPQDHLLSHHPSAFPPSPHSSLYEVLIILCCLAAPYSTPFTQNTYYSSSAHVQTI